MKRHLFNLSRSSLQDLIFGTLAVGLVVAVLVIVNEPGPSSVDEPNARGPNVGGPPAFGGPGAGGPGGRGGLGGGRPNRETVKLLKQFDEGGNGWLDAIERKAAIMHLEAQAGNGGNAGPGARGGRRGGPGFGGGGGWEMGEPEPGPQFTPSDVASYPDVPLYDPFTLRTLFLEFENENWEKELESFRRTDVDLPAKLNVDGRMLDQVGVRFRGNTSYSSVATGRKRPLNLTLDLVNPKQEIGGYSTLNLLNANGDPTFLRSVLYYEIARHYIPAFKANFMRVVINGESWGVYANVQQFDSKFTQDFFGTPKGARWKIPGSPAGKGGMTYLGDEIDPYRQIFELKSKEDPKSWVGLMLLCKTLNETPSELLESALAQVLDVDGVLKFLALDNVLVNNDGFWVRASDYSLYQDTYGQFHVLPYDANETFAVGRGGGPPGGGGGPGGGARGGRGPGGRGPGGFTPGAFLAPALIAEADGNEDGKTERPELVSLADAWFRDASVDKTDTLDRDRFITSLTKWVDGQTESNGQSPQGPGGRGGFSPIEFMAGDLFRSVDVDEDGWVAHADLQKHLGDWFTKWDVEQSGGLTETQFTAGINETLTNLRAGNTGGFAQAGTRRGRGGAGGSGGGPGGFRGRGGPGGAPGGRPGGGGVDLDPLILENDERRPLASKLLAVPELRARYLSYVRDIAENWLDWEKSGPLVLRYKALIEEDVKSDTRKLLSTEEFYAGFEGAQGAEERSLRGFFERRRAFLLEHEAVRGAKGISF